jgi:hypothetical protein
VIADADGFVVYGSINDTPVVWTSADGVSWSSVRLPGFHAFPSQAAASDGATVLLGVSGTNQCAHPLGEFLWQRARGQVGWVAAPFVEDLFCAGGEAQIAATKTSFVVAGSSSGDSPFAWHSATGLTWVDASRGLPADTLPTVLAATNGGFLELARSDRTDAEFSADGLGWLPVAAPPVVPASNPNGPGMTPVALIPTTDGVLAFYEHDDGSAPSAFRRQAGGTWTSIAVPELRAGDTVFGGTTIGGRTYVFARRPGAAALLASDDQVAWHTVDTPRLDRILGLARFLGQLVLVGSVSAPNGDDSPRVFVAPVGP